MPVSVTASRELTTTLASTTPSIFSPTSQTATSTLMPSPLPGNSLVPSPTSAILPPEVTTATLTPWPTLSPDEAADKVESLLADNQNPNCLLPCWWGAIPGQTRWKDIEPFLRSFAIKIDTTSLGASAKLPLPDSLATPGFGYYVSYGWDESGVIIDRIRIDSMNIPWYDPKTMATLYGIPDEIWVKTISEPIQGVLPFQLIMVYQRQGISFRYHVNATTNGETITACFEPTIELEMPDLFPTGPEIFLWEPGTNMEIENISPIPWEIYYPLETKSNWTPETFYEKFVNPNEQPCIDTPADVWIDY
jgi:hypothetical protein